jgi:hypothetical protein
VAAAGWSRRGGRLRAGCWRRGGLGDVHVLTVEARRRSHAPYRLAREVRVHFLFAKGWRRWVGVGARPWRRALVNLDARRAEHTAKGVIERAAQHLRPWLRLVHRPWRKATYDTVVCLGHLLAHVNPRGADAWARLGAELERGRHGVSRVAKPPARRQRAHDAGAMRDRALRSVGRRSLRPRLCAEGVTVQGDGLLSPGGGASAAPSPAGPPLCGEEVRPGNSRC